MNNARVASRLQVFFSTPGFEAALVEELARGGQRARGIAPGIVAADGAGPFGDPVFARQVMPNTVAVRADSVAKLAEAVYAAVEGEIDRWPGPFSLHALTPAEPPPGLASRAELIGREVLALLAARRRRAARRYVAPEPAAAVDDASRLLVQLLALERGELLVSAAAPRPLATGGVDLAPWPGGAAPVAIDRTLPSRAYQKIEEAFAWLGRAPTPGETCVDLGAAPGGWTAALLKRDVRVVAVDRASVDPPLAGDPRVTMVIGNAFNYLPAAPVDWLVSDVICEPVRSIGLIGTWLSRGLARNLVVTVKFKGQAGYGVLGELPPMLAEATPAFARIKQLAHNKNEVTVMVRCRP